MNIDTENNSSLKVFSNWDKVLGKLKAFVEDMQETDTTDTNANADIQQVDEAVKKAEAAIAQAQAAITAAEAKKNKAPTDESQIDASIHNGSPVADATAVCNAEIDAKTEG